MSVPQEKPGGLPRTSRFVAAVRTILSLVIAGLGWLFVSAAYSGMFATRGGAGTGFVIGLVLLYLGARLAARWGHAALRR